jgi:Ca-activated chloride channel family protein
VGDDKFLRDREGQVVVSKLNEEMARSIAKAGNGMYLHVDNSNNAQKILSEQLGNMMQNETKTDIYTNYEELFIYAALLALLFLCLDLAVNAATDIRKRKEKKTGK